MSSMVKGTQQRQLEYGTQVTKAAALFPQTTTTTLFTVTGGAIYVTSLFGIITTATTTDPQLSLQYTPTAGTAGAFGTTTAIANAEIGAVIGVQPSATYVGGGALIAQATSAKAGMPMFVPTPMVFGTTGVIQWKTLASVGGAMKWFITYVPLESGASVA